MEVDTNHEETEEDEEMEEEDEVVIKKMPNGLYNLVIGEHIKRELRKEWWESLIVKLMGRRISLMVMRRRLETMWEKHGSLEVIDLGNDYFLVRFFNSEDLDYAIMQGPWKIFDHYLAVRLWKPEFDPALATIDTIAAWVRLPGVAIEYYHQSILKKIGNIIGRTIKVDSNTADIARGKYARICVELDLTKPLVSHYMINGVKLVVEYEGLHQVCFSCGRVGHDIGTCPEKNQATKENGGNTISNGGNKGGEKEVEERGSSEITEKDKGKKVIDASEESYGP
ncbi:hypothetical protein S83_026012 [Arachis hypogaea]|nr:uncharacterized protein LOC112705277 [Arachis hypogaea]QHO31323.1 uncharacterized protein DS421_8g240590 [Arachis hypogaea]